MADRENRNGVLQKKEWDRVQLKRREIKKKRKKKKRAPSSRSLFFPDKAWYNKCIKYDFHTKLNILRWRLFLESMTMFKEYIRTSIMYCGYRVRLWIRSTNLKMTNFSVLTYYEDEKKVIFHLSQNIKIYCIYSFFAVWYIKKVSILCKFL